MYIYTYINIYKYINSYIYLYAYINAYTFKHLHLCNEGTKCGNVIGETDCERCLATVWAHYYQCDMTISAARTQALPSRRCAPPRATLLSAGARARVWKVGARQRHRRWGLCCLRERIIGSWIGHCTAYVTRICRVIFCKHPCIYDVTHSYVDMYVCDLTHEYMT